jgi:hypothetical protein
MGAVAGRASRKRKVAFKKLLPSASVIGGSHGPHFIINQKANVSNGSRAVML